MIPSEQEKRSNATNGDTNTTNDDAATWQTDSAGEISGPCSGKDRGTRFWIIMGALMLAFVISALDGAVVSTGLPTIVHDFNMGASYVWVVNIYFLTTAAIQPFLGQLSDLWGRRWVFIGTVALFVLGSGIIGGATSGAIMIAGRGVQGLGAGGINMSKTLWSIPVMRSPRLILRSPCFSG